MSTFSGEDMEKVLQAVRALQEMKDHVRSVTVILFHDEPSRVYLSAEALLEVIEQSGVAPVFEPSPTEDFVKGAKVLHEGIEFFAYLRARDLPKFEGVTEKAQIA